MSPERYVVVGAGAIGCAVAATLTAAGRRVVLVARRPEQLRDGVDVRTPRGAQRTPVEVVATLEAAGPTPRDLVVVAVMGQDTGAAVAGLAPDVPTLSLQNGTAPIATLAARGPCLAGVVYVPAERRAPDVVALVATPNPGGFLIGGLDPIAAAWAPAVADALRDAGFVAEPEPEIMAWVRGKLLTNLAGTVVALMDEPPPPLIAALQAEARALWRAAGHPFVDVPAFLERMGPRGVAPVDGRERVGGSTRAALARVARGESDGPLETASLHADLLALSDALGIAAPLNRGMVVAAERAVAQRIAPGSVSAAALRALGVPEWPEPC